MGHVHLFLLRVFPKTRKFVRLRTLKVCAPYAHALPLYLMLSDVCNTKLCCLFSVKRAQEVIMFGNQQNRGGDGRNAFSIPRTEKRGVLINRRNIRPFVTAYSILFLFVWLNKNYVIGPHYSKIFISKYCLAILILFLFLYSTMSLVFILPCP